MLCLLESLCVELCKSDMAVSGHCKQLSGAPAAPRRRLAVLDGSQRVGHFSHWPLQQVSLHHLRTSDPCMRPCCAWDHPACQCCSDQPSGRLALVFELMDMNIYELIRGRRHYLAEDFVRSYMWQLMKSMDHMHRNGIFHRDIKPENILVMDDCLKLADFGSCRGIFSKQPYTEYISTRW
jgi:serine/threonine protein kinase